jgi:GNAT superfamily N-acetyltransferase
VTYKIRPVDGTDPEVEDTIAEMHQECFPDYDTMPTNTGHWWIAYDEEDTPVAFAGLWPSVRLPATGYLCRGGVLPQARGAGLQRRLIRARERKALKLGWLAMISDTVLGNYASANNLIRCGYRMWIPPTLYASDQAIYWRRELVPGAP